MKFIFYKEIQNLIKDSRFYIIITIFFVLSSLSGVIESFYFKGNNEAYKQLYEEYHKQLKANSSSLQKIAFMNHLAIKKTFRYTFIVGANANNFPNYSNVFLPEIFFRNDHSQSFPKKSLNEHVPIFKFFRLDICFLTEILLSFLVILLVHDIFCKEKEEKTMGLIFSNCIPRYKLLLGKIFASFTTISISFTIGLVLQLLIIILYNTIPLSSDLLIDYLLFIPISFMYILLWILIATFVSILSKQSNIALSYLLIIWIAFVFIIPSLGKIFISYKNKLPSSKEISIGFENIEKNMFDEAMIHNGGWRGGNIRANAIDNHSYERNFSPIYLKYMDESNEFQNFIIKNQIDQLKYIYNLSSISPSFLYRRLCESVYGVGIENHYRFIEGLINYRNSLKLIIASFDAKDKDSFHFLFLPNYMSNKEVDVSLLPQFNYETYNFPKDFEYLSFFILFIEFIIIFLINYIVFLKYDPR